MTQPDSMLAMQWPGPGRDLRPVRLPVPVCGAHEVLLRVLACGVCRTDLHIVDADLAPHRLPLIPGHEIVGRIVQAGAGVERFEVGQRVGVPWLGGTCGCCPYCRQGRENLCDRPSFSGYDRDGGYAQFALADARYCFAIPARYDDAHAAPLLCAGLIGYRAYRMAGAGRRLGLYGFGAAAHIVAQVALAQGREVYAFCRPGDERARHFALSLGVTWVGASDVAPPQPLDAAIIFAPLGSLVPAALSACVKGGTVVCAGIHMSAIPSFPYALLWQERSLRSVANLTRADGEAFLDLAASLPLHMSVTTLPLGEANRALASLRSGTIDGAVVLLPDWHA